MNAHWKTLALAMAGAAVIATSIGFALRVVELPVSEYDTLADAEADGALARGWLPAFLPPNSQDIRETHNVDTNARWLEFSAPVSELRVLAAHLETYPFQDARRTALPRPARAGRHWPPELSDELLATPRSTSLLGYYRARRDAYCIAIEWSTGNAWGWSCPDGATASNRQHARSAGPIPSATRSS